MNIQKSTKNTGGCLKTFLILAGALVLISLLLGFGWIAGVVWLLFFRKKLNDEPEKQKKITILVSILSVFSFGFMIFSFVTGDSLESISISSDVIGNELEIDQDYVIEINSTPADAYLSDLTYNIDGSCATFGKSGADNKKAILHTTSAGTVVISVSSGEISSNSLEFHIVDTTEAETEIPMPATEKETESEIPFIEKYDNDIVVCSKMFLEEFINNYKIPLATQLWTIVNFDDNGAVAAMTDVTDKSTKISQKAIVIFTPTMENDKMTGGTPHYISVGDTVYGNDGYCDEFLTNLQNFLNEGSQEPTADDSASAHQDAVDNPQPENQTDNSQTKAQDNNPQAETPPETPTPNADMVWIDDTGKKYHSKSSCSNMDAPYQVTREQAISMGRDACKKCY